MDHQTNICLLPRHFNDFFFYFCILNDMSIPSAVLPNLICSSPVANHPESLVIGWHVYILNTESQQQEMKLRQLHLI